MIELTNDLLRQINALAAARWKSEKGNGADDIEALETVVAVVAMAVNLGKVSPFLFGVLDHAKQDNPDRKSRS